MTQLEIEFDEATHKYRVGNQPVPSVTQILGVMDKGGALTWWAQGIGVKGVCRLYRDLNGELPWDDPEGIVKLLVSHKLSCNHVRDVAATRGTSLHNALEAYLLEGAVPNVGDFPLADRGYVQALARALLTLSPKVISTEGKVASSKHGYAGRYDLIADVDGVRVLLDLKTAKRIYPESHFPQLAAYRGALEEMDCGPIDACWVLRLGADGEFEIAESYATFEDFLAIKRAYDALQDLKARGKAARAAAKRAAALEQAA